MTKPWLILLVGLMCRRITITPLLPLVNETLPEGARWGWRSSSSHESARRHYLWLESARPTDER